VTLARDPDKARAWQQRSAKKAAENRRAKPVTPLKRAKPEPRTPAPGKHTAKPRKPLPLRNTKRAATRRLDQFGTPEQTAMIVAMRCVCHDAPMRHPDCNDGPSDPSHVTTRGAGGKAKDQVPQSHGCHLAFHAHGRLTYVRTIGWTLAELHAAAARTWALVSGDGMPDAPGRYAPS
jgi:hypothetical protein